jgi:hypothetical protein
MNDDVQVRFGADISGLQAGAQQAKSQITGVEPSVVALADSMKALAAQMQASFAEMSAAIVGSVRQVEAETVKEEGLLKSLETSVRSGLAPITEMRSAIVGIGEAVMAAFAIEAIVSWAEHMGEAGEKILHIGLALGMTTREVQQLETVALATGMSLDGVVGAAQRLDRALGAANAGGKRQSEAFSRLGIDIREAVTPAELFNQAVTKLADMPPSLEKSQIAMSLFGRNLQEVAPLLGLTAEAWAKVNDMADEYGTKNQNAVDQAAALGEAFNENRVAMKGMSNIMAEEFAPTLTVIVGGINDLCKAFIQSYQAGGQAKAILDSLKTVFNATIDIVASLALVIYVLVEAIAAVCEIVGGALIGVFEMIKGELKATADSFQMFGQVAHDALTLHWDRIKGDMQAGLAASRNDVVEAATKMGRDAKIGFELGMKSGGNITSAIGGLSDFMHKQWSPPQASHKPDKPQRTRGDGMGDAKPKADKSSEEDALVALKTAFEAEENAHSDMIQDMAADELAYWQKVKDSADWNTLNVKQQGQVNLQIGRLTHQEAMAQLKQRMAESKDEAATEIADTQDVAAARKAMLDQQIADIQAAEKRGELSHAQANQRVIALIEQERQAALEAAQAIYTARAAADDFIMAHSAKTTSEYIQAQRDEVRANAERNRAIVAANDNADKQVSQQNRKTLAEMQQQWHGYVNSTVSAFGNGLKGLIEGTMSWKQAIAGVLDSVLQTFINIGERMLENWLVNLILGKAAQTTEAEGQVMSNAAVAASGAYAATAVIPFIGPELAPAAAAMAYTGAMAWAPLAAAAGGWGEVDKDQIAMVHQKEMILPAHLANPLRAMLANTAANGNTGSGWGGDIHLHNHNDIKTDIPGLEAQVEKQPGAMKRILVNMARNGELSAALKAAGVAA